MWPKVLATVVIVLLLLALGASVLVNFALVASTMTAPGDSRVREKHFSHSHVAANKVAIITLEGVILDGEGFAKRQIDRARKDPAVKAVVLRVNSPGGSVSGSDYLYHHFKKLAEEKEIPLVVSMGGMAASGGYYVSMAVGSQPDTIFAEPTTWTGSIGVIIPHYNASELMEKFGIKQDSIASHRLKGMGSFTRPMTDEERKILQGLVDDSFSRFKQIVRQGRPAFSEDPSALDRLATGQVFAADQAKQNGLVDKIGFLEDAVDQAVSLAGLSPSDVEVVEYKRELGFLDYVLGADARQRGFDPSMLLDLAVPRAYYLWSAAPSLLAADE